jgi:hypothetical protein
MSKFEKLLDLLVNEQKDEAEKLFHEIVVEKSRSIYEGILEDEEAETTEESADKDDADEVEEAMHKDEKKKKKMKEEDSEEDAEEEVEETEEPAESADETIEEIGGDATDDLISDIEAEGHGMDMGDEEGMDHDGDFDDDGDQDEETEEMFEPLEKELDQLKAEFAKMMDKDDDKPEESLEMGESKNADSIVKEYAEMVKSGHGAEKMGKEAGADQKKSPVPSKNKPVNDAKAHSIGGGADEKGGVGKALTGDTAKPMGKSFKNEGGHKSAKLDMAPKAETSEGSADAKSPVASK